MSLKSGGLHEKHAVVGIWEPSQHLFEAEARPKNI
jgi:hypothetical protein